MQVTIAEKFKQNFREQWNILSKVWLRPTGYSIVIVWNHKFTQVRHQRDKTNFVQNHKNRFDLKQPCLWLVTGMTQCRQRGHLSDSLKLEDLKAWLWDQLRDGLKDGTETIGNSSKEREIKLVKEESGNDERWNWKSSSVQKNLKKLLFLYKICVRVITNSPEPSKIIILIASNNSTIKRRKVQYIEAYLIILRTVL